MGVGGGGPSRTCASPRRGLQLSDPQWPGGNFLGSVLQFKTHPAHPSFLPPLLSHFQTHNNFSSISLSPNKYLASLICPSVCFPEVTKLTKQSGQREVWTEMVGLGSRSSPPARSVRLLCPQWLWVPQRLGGPSAAVLLEEASDLTLALAPSPCQTDKQSWEAEPFIQVTDTEGAQVGILEARCQGQQHISLRWSYGFVCRWEGGVSSCLKAASLCSLCPPPSDLL